MSSLALPTAAKKPASLALPGSTPQPATQSAMPATQQRPIASAGNTSRLAADHSRGSASPSPEPEDDADGEGDDDDEEHKKPKSSKKKKSTASAALGVDGAGRQEYRYTNEISQMDPLPETVRLVEDIVRGQIIEIVTRARLLTHLRSSRYLSAEDLIFLIRDDRGKVNRLRTYLSWKDVRKKAKEDDEGGDVDVDEAGERESPDRSADEVEKNAIKGRKPIVKLSWELLTPFSEFLRALPTQQNRAEEDEDEDEDELQAHEDIMQRLRDADEITKKMTKDEYVHYSDCRQASFTYRKALEVREQMEKSTTASSRTSALKRKGGASQASPAKRAKVDLAPSPTETGSPAPGADASRRSVAPRSLFAAPPSARQPLLPSHVLEAFAQIQRKQTSNRVGGMRNWRGGLTRGRVALV
ncbi:transcription factor TFIID subunit [Trichosporon asahii var. asahii CBS 8904]|uniref:Transcription factor TFIID subunit n=1 Tax=Trichosporon asahii var. asahii (strain CBS 8904) TaxID=1220162 RepID=K1V1G8_TRIAC|nr:transcription factor TFIID subunit [Trichosporon asahii var. asahii CBS 8904]